MDRCQTASWQRIVTELAIDKRGQGDFEDRVRELLGHDVQRGRLCHPDHADSYGGRGVDPASISSRSRQQWQAVVKEKHRQWNQMTWSIRPAAPPHEI